jgi:hypothetical protein
VPEQQARQVGPLPVLGVEAAGGGGGGSGRPGDVLLLGQAHARSCDTAGARPLLQPLLLADVLRQQ